MTKKISHFIVLLFSSIVTFAQLNKGDIAIIGYNADGNDNLSFVTFVDIPSGQKLIFEDNEWNGTIFTNTDEGAFSWTSTSLVSAGTVINIDNIGSGTITASTGSAIDASLEIPSRGTNRGIGGGDEVIYVYQGTATNPTFLTAFASGGFNTTNGVLTNTGLVVGTDAFDLTLIDEDGDIATYIDNRATNFVIAKTNIYNTSSWIAQDGTGDQSMDGTKPDAPFELTPFGLDVFPPTATSASVSGSSSIKVFFNEKLDTISAKNLSNYTLSPALTINSISYDSLAKSVTLFTDNIQIGQNYSVTVKDLKDKLANQMTNSVILTNLFFNNYAGSDLVISEIMYNPGTGGDTLEFLEIQNKGTFAINLGGLRLSAGVIGTLSSYSLAPNQAIAIAFDSARAKKFYGVNFLQWSNDNLGNGGEALVLKNSVGTTLDSVNYDDAAPWDIAADGSGPSLELINVNADNNIASNWAVSTKNTGKTLGANSIFASPSQVYTAPLIPSISFAVSYQNTSEDSANVKVVLNASVNPTINSSVRIKILPISTADSTADFSFASQVVTFAANGGTTKTIVIPISVDALKEADEYIGLELTSVSNANVTPTARFHTVYIRDNDDLAPVATKAIELQFISRYGILNPGSATGLAEIVTYDPTTKRLVTMSTGLKKFDIIDFSNPTSPVNYKQIDVSQYGSGITSISVKNGILAVSVPGIVSEQDSGSVLFYDMEGVFKSQVKVGFLPDMITFTPNGKWVLTANEGQPASDYSRDPEGSVSMIDVSGGVSTINQSKVFGLSFQSFNAQEAALIAAGVRKAVAKTGASSTVTLAQDLEPEFITVSSDSKKAWVTLQENNAVGVIDLENKVITAIVPLGVKDLSLPKNAASVSDRNVGTFIGTWPVKTYYMPDGMANYTINGTNYLVTANEGDDREYTALNERSRVEQITLDSSAFPYRDFMRQTHNLGRFRISNIVGDTDNDGDFDQLYAGGARSFAIWNSVTGQMVYDSGNDFERITALDPQTSPIFNSNHEENLKNSRSLAKGPEPEGVVVTQLMGKTYAFITLERIGGVIVYDITDPNAPKFVDYKNSRNATTYGGDNGPEGIIVIKGNESPTGKTYVVSANEVSGTLAIFEVLGVPTTVQDIVNNDVPLIVYPNPSKSGGSVQFNKITSGTVYNANGLPMSEVKENAGISTEGFAKGLYIFKEKGGQIAKFVIE